MSSRHTDLFEKLEQRSVAPSAANKTSLTLVNPDFGYKKREILFATGEAYTIARIMPYSPLRSI